MGPIALDDDTSPDDSEGRLSAQCSSKPHTHALHIPSGSTTLMQGLCGPMLQSAGWDCWYSARSSGGNDDLKKRSLTIDVNHNPTLGVYVLTKLHRTLEL
ncbi:hypothetical protein T265_08655 [Opisthorchis viverrini]|uniref:Uncharacterized protein n=1 Tax=Opisthorchis viverrini TaxID=6198 RepID=A0A075A7J3_OPIVI|nr:hypothetical protein T265_08655 [Opisthorchis viverrini]KER23434.1 hypothetical protein T265_08655 [Opisthorchis viverrini]